MKKKSKKETQKELNLPTIPVFDMPKNPKNASERVVCELVKLFETTIIPKVIVDNAKKATKLSCIDAERIKYMLPIGDGANEAYEHELNISENLDELDEI